MGCFRGYLVCCWTFCLAKLKSKHPNTWPWGTVNIRVGMCLYLIPLLLPEWVGMKEECFHCFIRKGGLKRRLEVVGGIVGELVLLPCEWSSILPGTFQWLPWGLPLPLARSTFAPIKHTHIYTLYFPHTLSYSLYLICLCPTWCLIHAPSSAFPEAPTLLPACLPLQSLIISPSSVWLSCKIDSVKRKHAIF